MRRAVVLFALVACKASSEHPLDASGGSGDPVCGDGVVDPGEACDHTAPPVGCKDVGFYEGATACSAACTVDTSLCSGTCGDGVINGAEECDGRPAPGSSCLAYSSDYGVVDCTTACVASPVPRCRRYGDVTLIASGTRFATVAANRRGAIGIADGVDQVSVSWDGVVTSRSGTGWSATTANGAYLIGLSPTTYGYFDGTWHDFTVALGASPAAAATSQGVMYVVSPDCTARQVAITTGASTAMPSAPATSCATPITVLDQLYVAAGAAGVLRWTGTIWTTALATPTTRIVRGIREHLLAIGTAVLDVDLSLTPPATRTLPLPAAAPIAADLDGTVVALPDTAIIDGLLVTLPANPSQDQVVQSEDGAIILAGFGAWRFEPRPIITSAFLTEAGDLDRLADGALAYCGDQVGWIAAASSGTTPWNGGALAPCVSLVGDPRARHALLSNNEIFLWTGTMYQSLGSARAIAGDGTQLFWLSADGVITTESGVLPLPASCVGFDLAGPPGALYAVGNCLSPGHAAVWKWNGSAFVEVASAPTTFVRAFVLGDGTLFGGDSSTMKLYRLDGTAWIEVPPGQAVFGENKTNYWVELPMGASLVHVQGTFTSEVRVPSAGAIEVSDRAIYGWDPNALRVFVLPRDPLRLTNLGL